MERLRLSIPFLSQQKRERLTPLPYDFYPSSPVSMRP